MYFSIRQARRGANTNTTCIRTGKPLPTDRAYAIYDPAGGELHPDAEHEAPAGLREFLPKLNKSVKNTTGDAPDYGVGLATEAVNATTICAVSRTKYGVDWE